jgi:hypothetical protein
MRESEPSCVLAFPCSAANVEPMTSTRTKPILLTNRLDLRVSNRYLGLFSGMNWECLKAGLAMAKLLKSSLPKARIAI